MKLSTHAPISKASRRPVTSSAETFERRNNGSYSSASSNYHWMTSGPSCCLTAIVSALITAKFVFGISLAATPHSPQNRAQKLAARSLVSAAKSNEPSKLLNAYFSRQTSDVKGQMRFVASLIQQHKRPIEDAERLAYSIVSESFRAGYDPLFVAAVIKAESTFKHSAVSNRGARGLMQILPTTARYVTQQQQIKLSGNASLHDPENNIKLGIAYLKYLDRKFNGNREKVLIAYNWGPGNLEMAMRHGGRVPGQSLQYARQILFNHRKWRTALSSTPGSNTYTITARGPTVVRPRYS